jgi:hypothetical protein
MPELVVPPIQPAISDFERFAKAYFNLELTSAQLQVVRAIADGKAVSHRISRRAGIATVNKIAREYIHEGLKPGGRVRLPEHPLPPRGPKMKGVTQEGKVLALIQRPGGAYNFELSRVALKYTSVISSLRKDGHDIIADRQYLKNGKASNTYRYRLGGQ